LPRTASRYERVCLVTPEVEIPAELTRAVQALRAEGLLGDMTDDELVSYVEGIAYTRIEDIVLRYYEHDELGDERARADRCLVYGYDYLFQYFGPEVIAELCELVGEPLFVPLGDDHGAIRVRGPRGDERIEAESVDDVVSHVNIALGERGHAARIFGIRTSYQQAYFALPVDRIARLRQAGVPLCEFGRL